ERWRYWTPAPGEDDIAGDPVWGTPTVDAARGVVYVPIGNSYGPRPSKHADALIALDVKTGKERWVSQFTTGDTWTPANPRGPAADSGAPPTLLRVKGRAAVGAGDKPGTYRAVDAATGKMLWTTKLTEGGLQGGVLAGAAVADGTVFVASDRASANA